MDPPPKPSSSLFQVYLRLRPSPSNGLYPTLPSSDRFLTVEEATRDDDQPTHITIVPPNENRRRAVEKFAFTRVFEEQASQLDIFNGAGVIPLVEGVLAAHGGDGRDGLLATLGVTGSGKSHTILGTKTQRGLTQLALDVLFRSIEDNLLTTASSESLYTSICASDPSEAQILTAHTFLEGVFGDPSASSRASSRAGTPNIVRSPDRPSTASRTTIPKLSSVPSLYPSLPSVASMGSPTSFSHTMRNSFRNTMKSSKVSMISSSSKNLFSPTKSSNKNVLTNKKSESLSGSLAFRRFQRPSALPQVPDISSVLLETDPRSDYAIVISMYEVYNDRIFDLLTPATRSAATKEYRRRPLLFKPTEQSPDRKVVAGLRKIICGSAAEALFVLEAGLRERRVTGTGSNSVSSRSHGFFCVEVKKRRAGKESAPWSGSTLTIVDLAGSERARDAKTQGATLAEAGKINESLMYLGQCLQMQSDVGTQTKPNLVPFRQCKLTELLFSNSFPSQNHQHLQRPQKAVMIVAADATGDYNATSQILRYSALAREITVPRVPSVTQSMFSSSSSSAGSHGRKGSMSCACERATPDKTERETMEIAALEIARMSEEIDGLRAELAASQEAHAITNAHLLSAEERLLDVEMEVREAVCTEMEARMEMELRRWKARLAEEADRADEHIDRKIEVLMQGLEGMNVDDENKENKILRAKQQDTSVLSALEDENAHLRAKVLALQKELLGRSPARASRVLQESKTEPSTSLLRNTPSPRNSPQPGRMIPMSPLARYTLEDHASDDDNGALTRNSRDMPGIFRETPMPELGPTRFVVRDDRDDDSTVRSSISFQSANETIMSPLQFNDDDDDDDIFRPQHERLATLKGLTKELHKPRPKLRASNSSSSLPTPKDSGRGSTAPRSTRALKESLLDSGFEMPIKQHGDARDDEMSYGTGSLRSSTIRGSDASSSIITGAQTVSRASQLIKEKQRTTRGSIAAMAGATAGATPSSTSKLRAPAATAASGGSPVKRVRKLAAKRWQIGDEDDF